jgi:magnesium-transporting ATPase (P-type)
MPLAPSIAAPDVTNTPINNSAKGLTSNEALRRLNDSGANSMPDTSAHPARRAIEKLWAPIPWMLEAAIGLELVLGKFVEAGIIAVLLLFNAVLGFLQEGRAQATLAALKKRLALTASVRRDQVWKNPPAADLVPGDVIRLSLGGVVAAEVKLLEGNVLLAEMVFCTSVLAIGHYGMRLGIATLQTLAFITLVCGNQAMTYAIRARGRIWSSPNPSRWLALSSVADLGSALTLAGCGWLMAPLPAWMLGSVLAGAIVFIFVLDWAKVSVFARLKIA